MNGDHAAIDGDNDVLMQQEDDVCTTTTAEERAHDELHAFFTKPTWFSQPSRQDHLAVLNLLQKFPRLRSTRFTVRYTAPPAVAANNNRMTALRVTPLRLLVEGRADLDIIRATYDLYPDVLSQDFDIIMILRRACEYRAPAVVVEFLSNKFPKALSDSCYKQIALACALRCDNHMGLGRSSLETIQVLLRLCPKSVHYVNKNGDNALNLAISNGYGCSVVKLILDVMQQQSCDLSLFCIPRRWNNFILDVHAAQAINLVLSRRHQLMGLETLECRPAQWTHPGFALMMHSLANHKSSLSSVQLDLPTAESSIPAESIHHGLKHLVNDGSRIQELELSAPNDTPTEMVNAALSGLRCGLGDDNNQQLQNLQLQGIQGLDRTILIQFLASEAAPRAVHIVSCTVHETQQQSTNNSNNNAVPQIQAFHKLERLELKNCHFDHASSSSLLHLVARMPRIQELCTISPCEFSEHFPRSDLFLPVEPLVAVLRNNVIQSLDIAGYALLEAELLYETVLTNSSLRQFRYTNKKGYAPDRLSKIFGTHKKLLALAMECGNTTLMDPYIGDRMTMPRKSAGNVYSPFSGSDHNTIQRSNSTSSSSSSSSSTDHHEHALLDAKIDYYKYLNYYGRSMARDPTGTTMETILHLLCNVHTNASGSKCFPSLDLLWKHNVQYGLLRESLSIWSSGRIIDHNNTTTTTATSTDTNDIVQELHPCCLYSYHRLDNARGDWKAEPIY